MSPTRDSVIRRRTDIRFRKVRDEWVVVRQQAAEVMVLNEWAGRVLELFDGSRTLGEIVDLLGGEYESEAGAVEADVLRFASEAIDSGLCDAVTEAVR